MTRILGIRLANELKEKRNNLGFTDFTSLSDLDWPNRGVQWGCAFCRIPFGRNKKPCNWNPRCPFQWCALYPSSPEYPPVWLPAQIPRYRWKPVHYRDYATFSGPHRCLQAAADWFKHHVEMLVKIIRTITWPFPGNWSVDPCRSLFSLSFKGRTLTTTLILSSGVEHSSLPVDLEATISSVSALPILRRYILIVFNVPYITCTIYCSN